MHCRRQAKRTDTGVGDDRVHPVLRALQGVLVAEVVLDRTLIHRRRGLRVQCFEPLPHFWTEEVIVLVFIGKLVPDVRIGRPRHVFYDYRVSRAWPVCESCGRVDGDRVTLKVNFHAELYIAWMCAPKFCVRTNQEERRDI